ncbi:MAG: GNAT family N-acetyltransferase [Flavobacteriaceae bacterium]|nr:GNAT family N-acetyltransferase [Flavobacteriaceae bacterium]
MKLESKNIKLRALELKDLQFLFYTENNTNFWKVSNTQIPFSKYTLTQYIINSHQDIYEAKQMRLIIENNKKPIGMVDLFDFNPQHKRAGIGILILQEFQNKGFATETLKLFIKYAFGVLNLHQLYANITSDNKNSIALFTKQNFRKTGIKKDWINTNNDFKDVVLFQLINK